MNEMGKYIKGFKESHPVFDCLGQTGGRWKWRRYLNGIDLRYGHPSKKAAEMARAQAAKDSWALFADGLRNVPCPKCHKTGNKGCIDKIGMCEVCAEKNYTL